MNVILENPLAYPPAAWSGEVTGNIHRWSPQLEWIGEDGQVRIDHLVHLETLDRISPA